MVQPNRHKTKFRDKITDTKGSRMSGKKSRQEKRVESMEEGNRVLTEGEWEKRAKAMLDLSDQAKKELWDENTGEYQGSQPLRMKNIVELHDCAYRLTGHGQNKLEVNIRMMNDIELLQAIENILQRKLPPVYDLLSLPQEEVVEGEECKAVEEQGGRESDSTR